MALPFWKLKRELSRFWRQLCGAPLSLYDRLTATWLYDRRHAKDILIRDGDLPLGNKVAIFLIFPRNGLLQSQKTGLQYLTNNGYAPFVVSNLPLSPDDERDILSLCWRYMQRPNVGYDFGGYRDAFLSLGDEAETLERLVFINDSSWFPLPQSRNWLQEAETLGVDYAAAAASFAIPRVPMDAFRAIKWDYDPSLRNFHYASYALSVGPALLRDRKFHRYWQRYALTADKNKVVRRGEIGLTRFVLKHGFSHGATYDLRDLPEALAACSDKEINQIAREITYLDDLSTETMLRTVVPELDATRSAGDRQDLISFILTATARIGVSYVLPELLYRKHGFPFLKKSLASINKQNSDTMMAIAGRLPGTEGRIIEEELHQIRRQKGYADTTV